jgi:hypothetical protein
MPVIQSKSGAAAMVALVTLAITWVAVDLRVS